MRIDHNLRLRDPILYLVRLRFPFVEHLDPIELGFGFQLHPDRMGQQNNYKERANRYHEELKAISSMELRKRTEEAYTQANSDIGEVEASGLQVNPPAVAQVSPVEVRTATDDQEGAYDPRLLATYHKLIVHMAIELYEWNLWNEPRGVPTRILKNMYKNIGSDLSEGTVLKCLRRATEDVRRLREEKLS